ncbi:MAG: hypothetical protein J0I09_05870 [Sphingobacteriia bacterium]|nr:hypothetical protein [Sphingobacteriia bacterium]
MKQLLLFFLLIACTAAFTQTNEWMVLRKRGVSVKTFFPGNFIAFQLNNYQWIEGNITAFRNDSIFLSQLRIQILYNAWGLPVRDTVNMGMLVYRINEIYALPLEQKGVTAFNNGSLLQVAGAGYIVLNAINSAILHDPFFSTVNLARIGIAAGVFMIGKTMQWNHPKKVILGKKYKLEAIKVDTTR